MNTALHTKNLTEGILTICLEPEDYQSIWKKNIVTQRKAIKTKGFRKGQAPRSQVEEIYGSQLLEQAIYQVAHEALIDYIKNYKLDILGAPLLTEHTVDEISPDNLTACTFTYRIGLTPNFELPNFDQLEVKSYKITNIEKETLDKIIGQLQKSHANFQKVELAEKDHILYGDIQVDSIPESKAPYYINLQSLIPSFQKRLLGKKVGDTLLLTEEELDALDQLNPLPPNLKKELTTTANKEFHFHLHTIFKQEIAPLDKNLYTKVLGKPIEREEIFREELSQILIQRDQQEADQLLNKSLKEALITASEISLPDEILQVWLQSKADKSEDPETLLQKYPQYAEAIRWDLFLEKFNESTPLKPSPEEIEKRLIQYLQESHKEQNHSLPTPKIFEEKAKDLLKKPKSNLSVRISQQLQEEKIFQLIQEKIDIEKVPITSHAFYAILRTHHPIEQS